MDYCDVMWFNLTSCLVFKLCYEVKEHGVTWYDVTFKLLTIDNKIRDMVTVHMICYDHYKKSWVNKVAVVVSYFRLEVSSNNSSGG